MGKLTTFVLVMCGLTLVFYMGGLVQNNPLLDVLLAPESIQNTGLWIGLAIAIAAIGIASGIGIGWLTKNPELAATTTFVITIVIPLMLNFTSVIVSVSSTEAGRWISALIFGPTMVMFVLTILEWTRGRD